MYDTFEKRLNEAISKKFNKLDIYFTGGEPFLNPDILKMIDTSLNYGNTTILTNGTRFTNKMIENLQNITKTKKFQLIFRISVDGPTREQHDAFRGKGSFDKTMKGIKKVSDSNFKTIITAMQSWKKIEYEIINGEFIDFLVDNGISDKNLNRI